MYRNEKRREHVSLPASNRRALYAVIFDIYYG